MDAREYLSNKIKLYEEKIQSFKERVANADCGAVCHELSWHAYEAAQQSHLVAQLKRIRDVVEDGCDPDVEGVLQSLLQGIEAQLLDSSLGAFRVPN